MSRSHALPNLSRNTHAERVKPIEPSSSPVRDVAVTKDVPEKENGPSSACGQVGGGAGGVEDAIPVSRGSMKIMPWTMINPSAVLSTH